MKTQALFLFMVGAAGLTVLAQSALPAVHPIPVQVLQTDSLEELLAGPAQPQAFPAWLAAMRAYRLQARTLLEHARGQMADPYADPALQWAQRSFIQPQMMAHDRYFYDPARGQYTVRRYLEDLRTRYGGIDRTAQCSTWPTCLIWAHL